MNYFIQNMIPSYTTHTESFFTPQFFVNHPVYAITVIFICLLSDKASNAEFFQIFPCELYHTYSTFRLLSLKTKRTIAYSNPTASCLSPRLKSTGNNRGETEVFNAVRRGFPEVKLQIETAVWPRQNRGKWFHSFRRYCTSYQKFTKRHFARRLSQSTIGGHNDSNGCTFIPLSIAKLFYTVLPTSINLT